MNIKTIKYALYAAIISTSASLTAPVATWGLEGEEADCQTVDVNGTCYDTFAAALDAIPYNTLEHYDITLHSDINDDVSGQKWFIGNSAKLDLNGHALTTSHQYYTYGASLEIAGTGTMTFNNDWALDLYGGTAPDDGIKSHLTVGEGVTLRSNSDEDEIYMIYVAAPAYQYGITVDFNGKIEKTENNKWLSGMYVQGKITDAQVNINIGESAVIDADFGAYLAGNTLINYAGTINAKETGIELRAGEINVLGGSITVDPSQEYSVKANGNGSTTLGAALAIAQHSTKLPLAAHISGGTLTANVPFSEANPQGNDDKAIAKVSGSITGGNFISTGDATVKSADLTEFITGGVYNLAPAAEYIAEDYTAYQTGANFRVLPTASTDAEDDANPDDSDISGDNTAVLSDIAAEAISGILANYDELDNSEYEFDNGLKVKIENADALRAAIAEGKTISAKLVKSDGDISDTLPAEEVSRLFAKTAANSEVLGIFDFSIVLVADGGDPLARVTELADEVSFTFDVSGADELADGATRTFQVIRHHNDAAEEVAVAYDDEVEEITFRTNKFSSFLIAYLDVAAETSDDASAAAGLPNTGANATGSASATSSATAFVIAIVAIFADIYVINLLRNRIRSLLYRG